MLSVRFLVEGLGVFERNNVPLELKILGLAFYIQLSSLRRAARALSEIHKVSKTAVWMLEDGLGNLAGRLMLTLQECLGG